MKKFLFTLAMLLMAGAAFADSYLYINKADVLTGDQFVEVPVKAHFSEYVSAWQVTITLPDGIKFDGQAEVGQDMTIPYFTDRGRTSTYTLSLSQNGVGGFLAASQQAGFYKLNGTWTSHGAIKWAPGDYDEMIILYLEVTDAYTGGDIMITTEPMCGADPRDIPMAVVDGGRTLPWVDETITAAEPTLAVDNEENPTQVTTNGVLYYCDETMTPGAWNIVTAPYTLPKATDVEQVLHFMAYTPNDEGKNDSKFVTLEVTIPAKAKEFEGTADVTFNGNIATLTYTSNDPDATVEVKVGETATTVTWTYDEATKTYTATYEVEETATEPGEHSVTVTLTVTPSDNYTGDAVSDSDTYTYKVNDELKGDIELGDVTDDGKVTVTYTPGEGDPENVELAVVVKDKDGKVVENAYADGVIMLPDYGEYTVTVTASATGYNDKTFDPETVTWNKKAVAAPVIDYTTYDTEVVVTITWPTSDGDQMYNGQYSYPRTNEDQSFVVEAYVTEGETCQESAHATETIPVPKKEVIAKPTITFSGEETTTMTITVSCETEGVTLYVNGEAVEGNPYSYTVTRADVYTAGTVNVTAVAMKGNLESETATGSKAWVVKDKPMAPEATKTEDVTDTQVTVNFTPAEGTDTEVSVKVGDETVTLPYVINRPAYGEEPITVTFVVTVTGDNYTTNTYDVVVTVQPQDPTYASKPKITFTPNATGVNVKIENYTEYTIKVNDELVDKAPNRAGTGSFDVEKGDVEKTIVVYANNAPENMIPADTTATYVLAAKKVYEVPDPTISVDNSDPTKTVITIEATVGDLTYTLTEDGKPFTDYTVEVVDGKTVITIENGKEVKTVDVTATTTLTSVPEGYDSVDNGYAEETVQTPVYVQTQTEMPTIDVSFGGDTGSHYALVTFVNNDDAPVVIEYCIGYPENEDDWITYTGAPVTISTYGTYVIYARAKAEGKTWSVVNERSFTLDDDATSVSELVNGKTVAGVRYFNMAGQEMQEANGITIVVTTYTDGTTSAVKVIK